MTVKERKPELLIPASSLEVLKTAVLYGADAVYIGGEVFSLRAKAKNFSMEEMAEGIAFAHEHGVKVYVTANILAHNADLVEAREYFATLRDLTYEPKKKSSEDEQKSSEDEQKSSEDEQKSSEDEQKSSEDEQKSSEDRQKSLEDEQKSSEDDQAVSLTHLKDATSGPVAAQPDALIISDPGMFMIAREVWPDCEIHVSTQANNTNYATFLFWHEQGVRRLVAARELSVMEIMEIKRQLPQDMEIECFVHGAMCISYSGRCLLSNFLTGRDANRGECTHPCRWKYALVEEKRPGEYMPVFEDERGTYLYHSKDLCMIDHLDELITAGADSLKVEGRMKNALYAATVARAYRRAIDDWAASPELYKDSRAQYLEEVGKCSNRGFTTGFYFGRPDESGQVYQAGKGMGEYIYLGTIQKEDGRDSFIQKNKFCVGDEIEVIRPDGDDQTVTVRALYNENMEAVDSVPHASSKCYVDLGIELRDYDIMRKKGQGTE